MVELPEPRARAVKWELETQQGLHRGRWTEQGEAAKARDVKMTCPIVEGDGEILGGAQILPASCSQSSDSAHSW